MTNILRKNVGYEKVTVIFPALIINDLRVISSTTDKGKISKTIRRACEQYINRMLAVKKKKSE